MNELPMGLTPLEEAIMAKENAKRIENNSNEFVPKPTPEELEKHIAESMDTVFHGEMTFIQLTPERTRVIFETHYDADLDDMARLVANADAVELGKRQLVERWKAENGG